jgi:hypothetical protein
MRLEIFIAVKISIKLFWVMTLCRSVDDYQHVIETAVSIFGVKVKISLLQAVEAPRVARGQGSHIT